MRLIRATDRRNFDNSPNRFEVDLESVQQCDWGIIYHYISHDNYLVFLVVGSTSVLCSCIDMNSKSNGMFFILILPLHAFGCGHRKRRFGGLSPTSCDHFVLFLSYVIHSSEGHMHLLCPDRPDNLKRLGHNL